MDHTCDTCRQPCQGGCRDYNTHDGQPRHGCADEYDCFAAWSASRTPDEGSLRSRASGTPVETGGES